MATRNERKAKAKAKAIAIGKAARAYDVAATVRHNLSLPVERNYYAGTISSVYAGTMAARAVGRGVSR